MTTDYPHNTKPLDGTVSVFVEVAEPGVCCYLIADSIRSP